MFDQNEKASVFREALIVLLFGLEFALKPRKAVRRELGNPDRSADGVVLFLI